MRIIIPAIFALFVFTSCNVTDDNPVNDLTGLKLIKLIVEDDDLERFFNNRFTDIEVPVKVNFEGKIHTGIMRPSGAGSRYWPKHSFRIRLDNTTILGYREFSLSAQPFDPTFIRTKLASFLYSDTGFDIFFNEPVFVTLNNDNYGLYNFIERIDHDFFIRRNIPVAELYKVQFDARFTFLKENRLEANFDKEIPDDDNYSSLADLIIASDNTKPEDIPGVMGRYMDIENYLWYHAVSSIRSDPDSYTNNFYLYKRTLGAPFTFIPWDFDKTFTGEIGLYGYNELIVSLLRNEDVKELYKTRLRFIIDNIFTERNLYPLIDQYYERLKEYYQYDPFLVNRNMEREIEQIKFFITERRTEVLALLDEENNIYPGNNHRRYH